MPAAAIAAITTRAPAAVEPFRPVERPSCLSTISAVKLSLSVFIVRTTAPARPSGRCASVSTASGAVAEPRRRRRPRTPRATSSGCGGLGRRAAAATSAAIRGRGRRRARRAAASRCPTKTASSPGSRRLSKTDSSPRIQPVTRVIPARRTAAASRARSCGRERRVAVALEEQVAAPGASRRARRRRGAPCGTGSPARAARAPPTRPAASRWTPARRAATRCARKATAPVRSVERDRRRAARARGPVTRSESVRRVARSVRRGGRRRRRRAAGEQRQAARRRASRWSHGR